MKSRFIQPVLSRNTTSVLSRIMVITGARQTGKTTLAKRCFPNYAYLSIEDPVMRVEYAQLTSAQWKDSFPQAVLDEVQKEPQLIESIKAVYDQYAEPRYVLLGSSQLLLLQKVKESLAGRCTIHEVFPLTLPELRTTSWDQLPQPSVFQQLLKSGVLPGMPPSFKMMGDYAEREATYRYYLRNGGYPALVDNALSHDDRYTWLTNYVRTYLERDIRDLAEFRSLDPFVKAQQITSLLTGNLVNYSSLALECGISPKTASRFLQYLEMSYQSLMLPPWHRNTLKRLVKSPKLHYLDPGVQKAILRKRGDLTGHEFESAIIAELYKQARVIDANVSFYHLRTLDGREVDLLIETESGYFAFEIKLSDHVAASDARHFPVLEKILDKPLLHAFIVSNDPRVVHTTANSTMLPAGMLLT